MSLLEKIEALRKQPKSVRDRYAFGVATGVTALVAVIWMVSLPARLGNSEGGTVVRNPDEPSLTEQLSELRNFVGDSIDSVQAQAELLRSVEQDQVETDNRASTYDYFRSLASSTEAGRGESATQADGE